MRKLTRSISTHFPPPGNGRRSGFTYGKLNNLEEILVLLFNKTMNWSYLTPCFHAHDILGNVFDPACENLE